MAAEKKELLVSWKALGFEPWTLGSKSALPLKPYFPDHSSIPQENVSLFFASPQHRMRPQLPRTMTSSALVSYDRCSGAEPTPSPLAPHVADIAKCRQILADIACRCDIEESPTHPIFLNYSRQVQVSPNVRVP